MESVWNEVCVEIRQIHGGKVTNVEPGRPWSEATFGGGTSFEVQSFVVQPGRERLVASMMFQERLLHQGLEEPPGMPVPEPWPEVPAPLLGLLLGEVAARCCDLGKNLSDTRSRCLQYFDVFCTMTS